MSLLVYVGPNSTKDVVDYVNQHDESILIEPLSWSCYQLRKMFKGHEGVKVVQAACGKRNGKAPFHKYNRGLSSSLSRVSEAARNRFAHADFTEAEPVYVRTIHLGKWLQKRRIWTLDTLIIDAQGHDIEILNSVKHLLPFIGTIITECDNEGFRHYDGPDNSLQAQKELLEPFGFVAEVSTRTVSWHPDVLWTRPE